MTSTAGENELLTAALGYAARGWRVVPLHSVDVRGCSCGKDCGSPGKHPRTKHGLSDGTTDPDQIRGWWLKWPRANVAVVCGKASGVWVVGPDGEQGVADYAALEAPHKEALWGAASRTQGGGRHLFFAWPADGEFIKNRKNHRGTKIDVRAEGDQGPGYVVAPPSVGEKGRYEWEHPPGEEFPQAPRWLVEWARQDEVKAAPARTPTPAPPADQADVHRRAVQYLNRCPEAVSGQRGHDALLWAARVLVWGFALPEHEALALLAAYYNPRCKPGWSEKELLHKVREAGQREFNKGRGWLLKSADPARDFPPPAVPPPDQRQNGRPQAGPNGPPVADRPVGITAAALVDREFPPPRWAVTDLLPEGLTVFAGRPKQGKSWLALLIATAVAAGHPLDGRAVPKAGRVLYLALEDTERRLKQRLLTLRGGVDWAVPERLHLVTRWPRADDGGLYHLAEFLADHPDTALVIVDTLAKFRTPPKGTVNSYADDYAAVGGLKELLDRQGTSGLLVHHTRKLKAEDPFDEMSGTMGISGAADGMWVLDRARGAADARLFVTGRDVADQTVPLAFDGDHCRWHLGAAVAGIEADGRTDPPAAAKAKECEAWLKRLLAEYARPSADIDQAGAQAGYSPGQVKRAKAALGRQGSGEVTHRNFGGGGVNDWWSGIGPPEQWRFAPGTRTPPGLGGQPFAARERRDVDLGRGADDGF